jgi:hypothetical protein
MISRNCKNSVQEVLTTTQAACVAVEECSGLELPASRPQMLCDLTTAKFKKRIDHLDLLLIRGGGEFEIRHDLDLLSLDRIKRPIGDGLAIDLDHPIVCERTVILDFHVKHAHVHRRVVSGCTTLEMLSHISATNHFADRLVLLLKFDGENLAVRTDVVQDLPNIVLVHFSSLSHDFVRMAGDRFKFHQLFDRLIFLATLKGKIIGYDDLIAVKPFDSNRHNLRNFRSKRLPAIQNEIMVVR